MGISFAKAVKYEAKGRIALIGPAGSGKSYTMLIAARTLAGPDGKIAAIDTEQGSLAKYADQFDFDVCPLSEFTAQNFLEALHTAEKEGYSVFCVDSLSHFWIGRGGALEFVDNAGRHSASRDGMSGWKEWRPWEQQMIDAMISSPCHILATMRTKTAYEEQVNPKTGKKQRVKIGLAPVQRDGLEYEFDLVGSMDEDNALIVDKTRCSVYAGKAITKPKEKDFAAFRDWLSGEPAPKVEAETRPELKAPERTKQDAKPTPNVEWNKAFAEIKSVDEWNEKIIPLVKERISMAGYGTPFATAAANEAKRRGYVYQRNPGIYELPNKKETAA